MILDFLKNNLQFLLSFIISIIAISISIYNLYRNVSKEPRQERKILIKFLSLFTNNYFFKSKSGWGRTYTDPRKTYGDKTLVSLFIIKNKDVKKIKECLELKEKLKYFNPDTSSNTGEFNPISDAEKCYAEIIHKLEEHFREEGRKYNEKIYSDYITFFPFLKNVKMLCEAILRKKTIKDPEGKDIKIEDYREINIEIEDLSILELSVKFIFEEYGLISGPLISPMKFKLLKKQINRGSYDELLTYYNNK